MNLPRAARRRVGRFPSKRTLLSLQTVVEEDEHEHTNADSYLEDHPKPTSRPSAEANDSQGREAISESVNNRERANSIDDINLLASTRGRQPGDERLNAEHRGPILSGARKRRKHPSESFFEEMGYVDDDVRSLMLRHYDDQSHRQTVGDAFGWSSSSSSSSGLRFMDESPQASTTSHHRETKSETTPQQQQKPPAASSAPTAADIDNADGEGEDAEGDPNREDGIDSGEDPTTISEDTDWWKLHANRGDDPDLPSFVSLPPILVAGDKPRLISRSLTSSPTRRQPPRILESLSSFSMWLPTSTLPSSSSSLYNDPTNQPPNLPYETSLDRLNDNSNLLRHKSPRLNTKLQTESIRPVARRGLLKNDADYAANEEGNGNNNDTKNGQYRRQQRQSIGRPTNNGPRPHRSSLGSSTAPSTRSSSEGSSEGRRKRRLVAPPSSIDVLTAIPTTRTPGTATRRNSKKYTTMRTLHEDTHTAYSTYDEDRDFILHNRFLTSPFDEVPTNTRAVSDEVAIEALRRRHVDETVAAMTEAVTSRQSFFRSQSFPLFRRRYKRVGTSYEHLRETDAQKETSTAIEEQQRQWSEDDAMLAHAASETVQRAQIDPTEAGTAPPLDNFASMSEQTYERVMGLFEARADITLPTSPASVSSWSSRPTPPQRSRRLYGRKRRRRNTSDGDTSENGADDEASHSSLLIAPDPNQRDSHIMQRGDVLAFLERGRFDQTSQRLLSTYKRQLELLEEERASMLERQKRELRNACLTLGGLLLALAVAGAIVVVFVDALELRGTDTKTVFLTLAPSPVPTEKPSAERIPTTPLKRILELLSRVSDRERLSTDGTPQNKALMWITEGEDYFRSPSDARFRQRYIMAVFFFSTIENDMKEWRLCSPNQKCPGETFLSRNDECNWFGVSCNGAGLVQRIMPEPDMAYRGNNLRGTLPSEISLLPALERLMLQDNFLEGTIPPELGKHRSIETLELHNNSFTGSIPDTFLNHPSLKRLSVFSNYFSVGPVPSVLASLPQLVDLQIDDNQFTGTIPTEYGALSHLELLTASRNKLTGPVPAELGNLTSLKVLRLSGNSLTSTLPSDLFSGWSNMRMLDLSKNKFTGTLSMKVGQLGRKSHDRKLIDLSENELVGPVPKELSNITRLHELYLHGNRFTGSIPQELCELRNISNNFFFRLKALTVDCRYEGGPRNVVECSCCTECH